MMHLNKPRGVIFGLAIGDALGMPTEFLSLPQIKKKYGQAGITDLPDPALFTDDSQMSIAIAEALIKTRDHGSCQGRIHKVASLP
jgi:ADP-ribosylglycohydrolase